MSRLKRHRVFIDKEYGTGWSDGEVYHSLESREDTTGCWVRAKDVAKLEDKIKRMQKRIDMLEGRV
ncbi:hypothetical protein QGX11_gp068 [Pseudomonas phage PPSC2]|uniref:Uncharacterized protein n=1 Tax=Pseudomonas phage PPSC2 TaxID=2041350 RepID=A0A2R2YAN3_9CAUD|nr:hypothetical protein QGX11_gp068 [Pseudomonas phage PPSC2]ATN92831.1 hypothetical protein PPSC2_68 [Pseudomonas phage PPSC2]